MKISLFATLAATALLAATSAFAAGPHDRDHRPLPPQERARVEAARPHDPRAADHFDRSQNYGFERGHRVTRDERRHWEEAHNYGYAQNHRVTPQEHARWEASYRR